MRIGLGAWAAPVALKRPWFRSGLEFADCPEGAFLKPGHQLGLGSGGLGQQYGAGTDFLQKVGVGSPYDPAAPLLGGGFNAGRQGGLYVVGIYFQGVGRVVLYFPGQDGVVAEGVGPGYPAAFFFGHVS